MLFEMEMDTFLEVKTQTSLPQSQHDTAKGTKKTSVADESASVSNAGFAIPSNIDLEPGIYNRSEALSIPAPKQYEREILSHDPKSTRQKVEGEVSSQGRAEEKKYVTYQPIVNTSCHNTQDTGHSTASDIAASFYFSPKDAERAIFRKEVLKQLEENIGSGIALRDEERKSELLPGSERDSDSFVVGASVSFALEIDRGSQLATPQTTLPNHDQNQEGVLPRIEISSDSFVVGASSSANEDAGGQIDDDELLFEMDGVTS